MGIFGAFFKGIGTLTGVRPGFRPAYEQAYKLSPSAKQFKGSFTKTAHTDLRPTWSSSIGAPNKNIGKSSPYNYKQLYDTSVDTTRQIGTPVGSKSALDYLNQGVSATAGIRRMATGSMIGAAYGGLSSDANHPNEILEDVILGGLVGAGIGFGTTKTFWKGAAGAGKLAGRGVKAGTKRLVPNWAGSSFMAGYNKAGATSIAEKAVTKDAGKFTKTAATHPIPASSSVIGAPEKNVGKNAGYNYKDMFMNEKTAHRGYTSLDRERRQVEAGLSDSWEQMKLNAAGGTGMLGGGMKFADKTIGTVLSAAANHPLLVGGPLATVGAAGLMFGGMEESPPPIPAGGVSRAFMNSAEGVSLGLHATRHGQI